MAITKNYFTDVPFFLSKNTFTSDLSVKKDQNSIRQSVINILLSRLGEKSFDYNFGTIINDLLFENIQSGVQLAQYKVQMQSAFERYEPRISVDRIDITQNTTDPRLIEIELSYIILDFNVRQNVSVSIERTR
jgi:phage baseplate assembly protein W